MAFRRKIFSRFLPAVRTFHSSINSESSAAHTQILGIHVLHCPDVVGIVSKVSECIAFRGANIHSVEVFVPENKQVFYSRRSSEEWKTASMTRDRLYEWKVTPFELYNAPIMFVRHMNKIAVQLGSEFVFDPASWPRELMDNDFMNIGKLFKAERSVVRVPNVDPKFKISIIVSKQDHCLVEVLHGWQDGRLPVDINCVISNHDRGSNTHVIRFLERHGIPYHFMPTSAIDKREEEILNLVKDSDFLVLARYMQVLSASFLEGYGKDIINIHHGLLPSFKGSNPAKQAYNAGVKLIGATTHFVTPELDAGPIIEQMVERVSHRDTLESFVQKSESLEKQCLRKAIKSYCELRVLPYEGKKTVVF